MTRLSDENTETLIRESLDRLATRAPDGHEVREVLTGIGRRQKRPRMALALVAAAVAVIALGVPLGLKAFTAVPPASPPDTDWSVLPYKPGWLPAGLKEIRRGAKPSPAPQTRMWGGDLGHVELTSTPLADRAAPWSIAPAPNQVVVHGRIGMVSEVYGTQGLMLTWSPDDTYLLSLLLFDIKDPREVGQRIADEMVPDGRDRVAGELRFGGLPADLEFSGVSTTMTTTGGVTELEATRAGQPAAAAVVKASLGGQRPDTDGAEPIPLEVRGVDGLYLPAREGRLGRQDETIAVQVEGGRWLTVSGKRDRATLLGIADGVQIIRGDYSWFGKVPE